MSDNITNKRSYIHEARKRMQNASDLDKKYRIVQILHKHFKLNALGLVDEFIYCRERETNKVTISRFITGIDFNKYQINRIDLYISQRKVDVIIEIDGLSHGFFDEITQSQQTIDRDLNYSLGGYTKENKNYVKLTTKDLEEDDGILVTLLSKYLGVLPES